MLSHLNRYRHFIAMAGLCVTHILLEWHFLHLDLWSDELYTLENFVFVPFIQTFTDYHLPNNHIFFSLCLSGYTELLNLDTVGEVLSSSWLLRLLMLFFSISTIIMTYLASEQIRNGSGLFTGVALVTTIPFINFSLQVRGYGLTFLLLAAFLYVVSLQDRSRRHWLWVVVLTALIAYTIPSNYYLLIALFVPAFLLYLRTKNKDWLFLSASIMGGVLLSLIFFGPVLKAVFFNPFVASSTPFSSGHLASLVPWIAQDMIGGRYFMLSLTLAGSSLLLFRWVIQPKYNASLLLLSAITIPFLVSFVRGDQPFMRSFVFMTVPFAIIAGIAITAIIQNVRFRRWVYWIVLITLGFEGWMAYLFQFANSENECLYNITHAHRAEDLGTCYFQHRYQPSVDVARFSDHFNLNPKPLVVHKTQAHDLRFYLTPYAITLHPLDRLDSMLNRNHHLYVVSENPLMFIEELQNEDPRWSASIINDKLTYHTFIDLSKDTMLHDHLKQLDSLQANSDLPLLILSHSTSFWKQRLDSNNVFVLEIDDNGFLDSFNKAMMNVDADSAWIFQYNCDDCASVFPILSHEFKPLKQLIKNEKVQLSLYSQFNASDNSNSITKLNNDKRYTLPLKIEITEEDLSQGRFWQHSCTYALDSESTLVLVISVKNDDETVYWKGINMPPQVQPEHVNYYFALPEGTKVGDTLELYFWLEKGKEAAITKQSATHL